MGFLELLSSCKVLGLSRYTAKTCRKDVSTDDSVDLTDMGSYCAPIPISQPFPSKDGKLGKLVHKADMDTKLRCEIESILFFYEISFEQVVFEFGLGPAKWDGKKTPPIPLVRVKGTGAVSPLTWFTAAGKIADALMKRDLGMFLVDIVPLKLRP